MVLLVVDHLELVDSCKSFEWLLAPEDNSSSPSAIWEGLRDMPCDSSLTSVVALLPPLLLLEGPLLKHQGNLELHWKKMVVVALVMSQINQEGNSPQRNCFPGDPLALELL
jgi:hypothetical protein